MSYRQHITLISGDPVGKSVDPTVGYLVYDDFIDPDGTHLHDHAPERKPAGAAWADIAAGITIQANKANDNSGARNTVIDAGAANVIISANLVLPNNAGNGFFGLCVRSQDSSHYHVIGCDLAFNKTTVWENDGGSWTQIANVAHTYTNGQAVMVIVTLSGNSIKGTFNGTADIDISEASFATATKHGLYSDCAGSATPGTWANFRIA